MIVLPIQTECQAAAEHSLFLRAQPLTTLERENFAAAPERDDEKTTAATAAKNDFKVNVIFRVERQRLARM